MTPEAELLLLERIAARVEARRKHPPSEDQIIAEVTASIYYNLQEDVSDENRLPMPEIEKIVRLEWNR